MQSNNITWDELKNQFYHNLQNLKTSNEVAQNSSLELYRIYKEVMNKSKNTDPQTLKKFTDSWLKKLKVEEQFINPNLIKNYRGLMEASNISEQDLDKFEQVLQKEYKEEGLILISAYFLAMKAFYDTWMEMWSN